MVRAGLATVVLAGVLGACAVQPYGEDPPDAAGDGEGDVASDTGREDSSPGLDARDVAAPDDVPADLAWTDVRSPDAGPPDVGVPDVGSRDSGIPDTGPVDTGIPDTGPRDTGVWDTGPTGPITGGPCLSGAPGATAFRVRWTGSGGRATVSTEENGLPDRSRWRVGAYAMSIGYTPVFSDMYLGEGGLELGSGTFVDIEMSTVGMSSLAHATLSIYGRSFSTGSSGSFTWQTFLGMFAAPPNSVSNVAPYRWYAADATAAFRPGDGGVLLRIRPGPSSGVLVVNRIELCLEAS
jgi:hypothetical protein